MKEKDKTIKEAQLIKKSNMFDAENYLKIYPDVRKTGMDPIFHYVMYGAREGRMPATWFDTKLYLQNNKDVENSNMTPFLHYILYGVNKNNQFNIIDPELEIEKARQAMHKKNYLKAMQLWTSLFLHYPKLLCDHEDEMELCLVQGILNNNSTLKTQLGQELDESKFKKLLTLLQACTDEGSHEAQRSVLETIFSFAPQAPTQASRKKLLSFFSLGFANLKFFSGIIKCIPPHQIDIIFDRSISNPQKQEELLSECGLSEYSVLIGVDNVANYQAVFMDILSIGQTPGMMDILRKNPDVKTISMFHSIDNDCVIINYQHCTIVSCENHTKTIGNAKNNLFFTKEYIKNNEDLLNKIHPYAKVEIGYTGPSHMGDYLHRRHLPKAVFREEMEDILQKKFDSTKKIVAVFENSAVSDVKSFPDGLNQLAKHAHIILKAYTHKRDYLKKLSPNITIWPVDLDAPNALRFGVDCILAGYRSGTFFSSCMLGLSVIPFYTRYVHPKYGCNMNISGVKRYPHHSEWWLKLLDFRYYKQPQYELSRSFLKDKKVFDFSQTSQLVHAIYKNEYWDWYRTNLETIQSNVFGDYILEGAAEKTAQMILDFAQYGTLGKNCSSLYLHSDFCPK